MSDVRHNAEADESPLAPPARGIPEATIARLPFYLRALGELAAAERESVASGELAEMVGVQPAQLRKDLSFFGSYGVRGVGYDVGHLRRRIGEQTGSSVRHPVAIVGVGNLGTALANHSHSLGRTFTIAALLDVDPELVGRPLPLPGGDTLIVQPMDRLEQVLAETEPSIVIIATPARVAQAVCDRIVAAGVRQILNFAATRLQVGDEVAVRQVDVGQELQILAYHAQHPRTDSESRQAG